MNKAELIKDIATKSGMTRVDCEKALSATLESIIEVVASGETVKLVGFGIFEPKERAERMGRNPKTKEEIMIGAKTVPVFKAGKEFKDAVAQ